MNFKNKQALIDYVKQQLGIELENKEYCLNDNKYILYTKIERDNKFQLLTLLNKLSIKYTEHLNDYYWIYLK